MLQKSYQVWFFNKKIPLSGVDKGIFYCFPVVFLIAGLSFLFAEAYADGYLMGSGVVLLRILK